MTKTVVVYHSGYGHTQRIAQFVAEGAGAELVAIDANGDLTEAQWNTLNAADAIIFGAPTYMGSASWQFKKFSDASSKSWFVRGWADKVAGGFTVSNSPSGDKLNTLQSIVTFAMQHGMVWVGVTELNDGANINRLGSFTGLMAAQEGPTKPAEELHAGDLETAKLYGKRVAAIAAKLRG